MNYYILQRLHPRASTKQNNIYLLFLFENGNEKSTTQISSALLLLPLFIHWFYSATVWEWASGYTVMCDLVCYSLPHLYLCRTPKNGANDQIFHSFVWMPLLKPSSGSQCALRSVVASRISIYLRSSICFALKFYCCAILRSSFPMRELGYARPSSRLRQELNENKRLWQAKKSESSEKTLWADK